VLTIFGDYFFVVVVVVVAFQAPPELHPELRNRSVELNSTFTIKCTERGDRPLYINWTKNGVDLGNRDNNTYTVDHVTLENAGLYECTAVNWAGKTNAFFWVDVTGKANANKSAKIYQLRNWFDVNFGAFVQS